ncbi:MAG TPA: acyltransferase family protein, partial [Acidobacteriaceae bacterium]|nr:acyltransferase family protein [Acidobacteriaceae bacterium]
MAPRRLNSGHFPNLNAVRLSLALLVVLSHSVVLCWGANDREFLFRGSNGYESFGSIAVDGFFLISGMLITASWFRCGSLRVFLYRRILRIYPGYILALLFGAGVALCFSPEFRLHLDVISYAWDLARDTVVLGMSSVSQPAAFQHNPFPGVLNGSLWTINHEFQCYLLVAFLGFFSFLDRRKSVLFASVLFWMLYARDVLHSHHPELSDFRFVCFFVIGMVAWLYRDKLVLSTRGAAIAGVILLATLRFSPWFSLALPLAGSYLL